jgi:hypothetical protein
VRQKDREIEKSQIIKEAIAMFRFLDLSLRQLGDLTG